MEIKKTTTISGYVVGTLWSEERGYTRSKEYKGDNLTALLAEVEADFNGGKLTARHDLSKQTGARLEVTTISTVVIDGDVFKNEKTNTVTFGDWSEYDEIEMFSLL